MHPHTCPVPKSLPLSPNHSWQHLSKRFKHLPAKVTSSPVPGFPCCLPAIRVSEANRNICLRTFPVPAPLQRAWPRSSTRWNRSDANGCTAHLAGCGALLSLPSPSGKKKRERNANFTCVPNFLNLERKAYTVAVAFSFSIAFSFYTNAEFSSQQLCPSPLLSQLRSYCLHRAKGKPWSHAARTHTSLRGPATCNCAILELGLSIFKLIYSFYIPVSLPHGSRSALERSSALDFPWAAQTPPHFSSQEGTSSECSYQHTRILPELWQILMFHSFLILLPRKCINLVPVYQLGAWL